MSDLTPEITDASVPPEAGSSSDHDHQQSDSVPEFGLLDVIEAFTAMRHEYRGQTRETRDLAAAIRDAADQIGQIETRLAAGSSANSGAQENHLAARLVESLIEVDLHLSRAADAATQYERSLSDADDSPQSNVVHDLFRQLNPIARWFCRSFHRRLQQRFNEIAERKRAEGNPTTEGLTLLAARVRRLLEDRQIDRFETTGQPFDAERMTAIDAVAAEGQPSGIVLEQLSPAYQWQGRLVRYAEVRVAK